MWGRYIQILTIRIKCRCLNPVFFKGWSSVITSAIDSREINVLAKYLDREKRSLMVTENSKHFFLPGSGASQHLEGRGVGGFVPGCSVPK